MTDSLPTFLKNRSERSFRYLSEQLGALTAQQAMRGREANWPGHSWGIGQDGSIAGIAWHVAGWKQRTLPILLGTTDSLLSDNLDEAPDPEDWTGILAWLKQIGAAWNAELALLPEAAFEETRNWNGNLIPVWKLVAECYEHDIQHAAQIEHLRVRYAVEDAKRQVSDP